LENNQSLRENLRDVPFFDTFGTHPIDFYSFNLASDVYPAIKDAGLLLSYRDDFVDGFL
jgi:hypothetical protein